MNIGYIIAAVILTFLFVLVCVLLYQNLGHKENIGRLTLLLHRVEAQRDGIQAQNIMMGEGLKTFEEMNTQQNIIALWLRENCKKQIAMGLHNGRGLGEVVVGYLTGGIPSAAVLEELPEPVAMDIPERLKHLVEGPRA